MTALSFRAGVTWTLGGVVGFVLPFFATWILIDVVAGIVLGDAAVAFLEGPVVFGASLTAAFALGGAGLGFVQWLHVRRRFPGSAAGWIGGTVAGFAALGVVYVLMYAAFGEPAMERFGPRLANETLHNLVGGAVAGLVAWRAVLRPRGVPAIRWVPFTTAGLVAAGLVAWLVESAAALSSGDAAPVGMLVFGAVTAWGFRGLDGPGAAPRPAAVARGAA